MYEIFAVPRSWMERVQERSMELDHNILALFLLHRYHPTAQGRHQVLRGRKIYPSFQLHVVRLPADPLHDRTRDVGNTNPRTAQNGL